MNKKRFVKLFFADIFVFLVSFALGYLIAIDMGYDLAVFSGINIWLMISLFLHLISPEKQKRFLNWWRFIVFLLVFPAFIVSIPFSFFAEPRDKIMFIFLGLFAFNFFSILFIWTRFKVKKDTMVLVNDRKIIYPGRKYSK